MKATLCVVEGLIQQRKFTDAKAVLGEISPTIPKEATRIFAETIVEEELRQDVREFKVRKQTEHDRAKNTWFGLFR